MKVKSGEKKNHSCNILWDFKGREKAKLLEESRKMNLPVSDEGATTEASGTATHDSDKPEGL